MKLQLYWIGLIVPVIVVVGGVAQAQTVGARDGAETAAGVSDRIDPGSRWGRGLELSADGRARSYSTSTGEKFVVNRDTLGSSVAGPGTVGDYRMTLGYRGIWPTGSDLTTNELGLSSSDEDDEQIIYYTMRYDGIRLGLSYFPGLERGAEHSADSAAPTNHDGIALGANYYRWFDEFGVGVSAGYKLGDAFDDLATPDTETFTVGARFDVGGFRVSGAFQKGSEPREDADPSATSDWDEAWNLGARYRWGRNDVSLAYAYGENRAVLEAPGEGTFNAATLSYVREFDRGVKWSINLLWADHDSETTGGADDDGAALSTAIRLSF